MSDDVNAPISHRIPPLTRRTHPSAPRKVDAVREADVLRVDFPKDNPDPSLAMRWIVTKVDRRVSLRSIPHDKPCDIDKEYLRHLMMSGAVRRETPIELASMRES